MLATGGKRTSKVLGFDCDSQQSAGERFRLSGALSLTNHDNEDHI